jgi:hypothetical protein
MSNYSMAFDRLRRESGGDAGGTIEPVPSLPEPGEDTAEARAKGPAGAGLPSAAPRSPATPSERVEPSETRLLTAEPARSPGQRESYGGLLDTIRSISRIRGRVPYVVLAGASHSEAVDRVVGGLVETGLRRGIRVVALELAATPEGRQLQAHRASPVAAGDTLAPLEVSSPRPAEEIDAWLSGGLGRFDAVIVEGPALSDSADAALLGRELDGLFVVAEQGRTRGELLKLATQRAKSASSTVHGLVLTETRSVLPTWLSRLLGAEDA